MDMVRSILKTAILTQAYIVKANLMVRECIAGLMVRFTRASLKMGLVMDMDIGSQI